ncbi:folate biopterin transporter [Nannochloropsis oceanica]
MALKTEGSAFDGIPSPPALQSQRTKLICENNSYYRWAEEEARYTDPHQLVSPWSSLNIAMPLSAFFFQLTSTFFSVPIAYYVIKNLGMNAAATNVAQQMTRLPQAFQIPIGLLTDCVPIRKRRRKHYILIGWLLHIGAMTALAVVGEPDITSLVGLIFLSFTGGQIMDLAQRALIIQRSRHEREDQKGVLMVTVNLGWTWGNMIGYILGTFSYESNFNNGGGMSIGNIATFNACVGAAFLPFLVTLYDTKVNAISKTRPMGEEMADVWAMVQRKSVLMPMLFVGIFQVFWVPNSVWTIFLVEGLHFTEWNIGLMGLLGSILGACGASMYRLCFMHVSWRKIFVFTSLIMAGMNCLTLLLVFRVNKTWGISDYFFASGDNLVESLVDGFHIMPISIMYMGLCPGGAEGTALAAIQTFASLAVMMSSNIGLLFLRIWDVDGGTIAAGNFEGVWKITLLCGLFQLVGVFFVKLLPRNAKHQEILQSFDRNIVWGGICFIAFVILAFILTIGLNVTYMVHGDLVS